METKTTKDRGTLLRRGKVAVAALVTLIALGGAVQAVVPTSAVAMWPQCEGYQIMANRSRAQGEIEKAIMFDNYLRQCRIEEEEAYWP